MSLFLASAVVAWSFSPIVSSEFSRRETATTAVEATDAEDLKTAKALFFDRQYAAARTAWQRIASTRKGEASETAAYWIARCSESLGEHERAFTEYGTYLELAPRDEHLREEALVARLALAARFVRSGKTSYATTLTRALGDSRETVRHFAALQLASAGGAQATKAIPILREIVSSSDDPDVVDRAKLHLLRLDPSGPPDQGSAASPKAAPAPRGRPTSGTSKSMEEPKGNARLLRIRITREGKQKVAVTVPFSLAEFVFNSLPAESKKDLEKKGYDAEGFWKRLRALNISDILSITTEDGELIEIWIE